MGVIEQWVDEIIKNLFGVVGNGWVQRKSRSPMDLETCGGFAISDNSTNTCELCVALNKTVFKNNNKPLYYHRRCKCINKSYNFVDIKLDFPERKVCDYLFKDEDKFAMMRSLGYKYEDWKEIYLFISHVVVEEFKKGNYELKTLNEAGQHFKIVYELKGKNEHKNQMYLCHSGCVAYPNAKIKIATPLIKDKEIKL